VLGGSHPAISPQNVAEFDSIRNGHTTVLTAICEKFRRQMPIARRFAYFDHAAVGPLPEPTRAAIARWLEQATDLGDTVWPEWARQLEQGRQHAAAMIGADPDEIALVPNTTTGINFVAQGLPWQAGDNVVTLANEFPSNVYPWQNLAPLGVETRLVEAPLGIVDLNRLEAACDERTRVLSVSWVGYASGYRIDLHEVAELCRRKNVLFFLDAIQGLGVFPIDVGNTKVDFLAADGHKWLLGPEGAGILYIRRERLDLLRPVHAGWNSVQRQYDFGHLDLKFRAAASRYEGGSANMAGQIGFAASLALFRELGTTPHESSIGQEVENIRDHAHDELARCGAEFISPTVLHHNSGILTFNIPGIEPAALREKLLAADVVVSCRGGGVRISAHGYNNQADVARLIEVVRTPS
jgi:cysteine desulfurase / selenocysteine lyase